MDPTDSFNARLGVLDDYVSRALGDDELDAFEESLCLQVLEGAAPELAFHEGLERAARELDRRGTYKPTLTPAEAERLLTQSPLRVVVLDLAHESRQSMRARAGAADIVLMRPRMDLRGVQQVDIEIYGQGGGRMAMLPDVDFDPQSNEVILCCDAELHLRGEPLLSHLPFVSVEGQERRVLAYYAPLSD